MPSVSRSALVPFAASAMYSLINDIENYPKYVPGCNKVEILSQDTDSITAKLSVSKSGVENTFTTRNTLKENEMIKMDLVDGPFKSLTGVWQIKSLAEDACKIDFNLEFEFKNKLIGMAFGRIFKDLAESMMQAFINRAKQIATESSGVNS